MGKLNGLLFKLKNRDKIENVNTGFIHHNIRLVNIANYVYSLNNMITGFSRVPYTQCLNNLDSNPKLLQYTDFYFYLNTTKEFYEHLIIFLSIFDCRYTVEVSDDELHVLFRVSGKDISNVFDCKYSNVFISNMRNVVRMIDKRYFNKVIEHGMLEERDFINTDLDEYENMEIYRSIINNHKFVEDIIDTGEIFNLEHDNKLLYDRDMLNIFGYRKICKLLSPPVVCIANRQSELSDFDMVEEINNITYAKFRNVEDLLYWLNEYNPNEVISNKKLNYSNLLINRVYAGLKSMNELLIPEYEYSISDIDEIVTE